MQSEKHPLRLQRLAIKDGEVVDIFQVATGLACECTCECGQKLIAKNRATNKKQAHFQHHGTCNSQSVGETLLHRLAKQIIARTKTIRIPTQYFEGKIALPERELVFDRVASEDEVNNWIRIENGDVIKPDLIGFIGSHPLLIEIAVTHACDEEKIRKIKAYNEAAIEIMLHESLDTVADVEQAIASVKNVEWLHNPNTEKYYRARKKRIDDEHMRNGCELVPFDWDAWCDVWGGPRAFECVINCRFAWRMQDDYKTSSIAEIPVVRRILQGGRWNGKCYPKQNRNSDSKPTTVLYVDGREIQIEEWLSDILCGMGKNILYQKRITDCEECEFHKGLFENNVICGAPLRYGTQ